MKIDTTTIKGAIFDLDGTLLDSMPVWEHVAEEYLIRKGICPKEDLNERFKTMSLQQSARYYQTHYAVEETVEKIINGVNALIEEAYENIIPLKEGVYEFLSWANDQGIKMCIATATERSLVKKAMERNGISRFVQTILTCSELNTSKEEPLIYEEALHRLGTAKESTLVFEDAYHAIKTAKDANFIVVAVEDNAEKENTEKIKEIADYYVKSVQEMRQ